MASDGGGHRGLSEVVTSIVDDYENRRPPFGDVAGITMSITDEMDSDRDKALFLTLTAALNRQRDAERLYGTFERLWHDAHWIFEPTAVVERREFEGLADLFEREGVRFGERDAEVWYEICRTLYQDYGSDPVAILSRNGYRRERIADHVRERSGDTRFFEHGKKFPVLRGDHVLPFWLQRINNQIHPLGVGNKSSMPVDRHVVRLTNELLGTAHTESAQDKEAVREFWRSVCEPVRVTPVELNGALWYIHRDWEKWGKRYLRRRLGELPIETDGV